MTKARDLANAATALNAVTATEIGYVDGVTSAIQTQLDAKLTTATASSTYIPKTLTTTTGDIIYASSANTPARLGIGSTGNVLTVASGIPSWAAPAGGGKVLQVVYGTSTTETTVASSTFTDTNLSASITPTSSSSTILIFVNQAVKVSGNNSDIGANLRILKGSTEIYSPGLMAYIYVASTTGKEIRVNYPLVYRDSPATTSSITYKTQGRVIDPSNSGSSSYQLSATSSLLLMEIGA